MGAARTEEIAPVVRSGVSRVRKETMFLALMFRYELLNAFS